MKNKIEFLGIDIGGAHLKIIGLDKDGIVIFAEYSSCRVWEGTKFLGKLFKDLNNLFPRKTLKCAITITAEMCDNFKDRKEGFKKIIKLCQILEFKKYFYVNNSQIFKKKPKYSEFISMNWHSIGRFLENKVDNAILLDFGSTTTDLVCIKDNRIANEYFDDFLRINNYELKYTGFTRTPLYGITHEIKSTNNVQKIIPENFSESSDIYRVLNKLDKKNDVDKTSDNRGKTKKESLIRISRNFGFDYKILFKKKIEKICNEISSIQLYSIYEAMNKLQKKFQIKKPTIIVSGIGQDVLSDYLKKKGIKTIYLHKFLRKSKLNKKASFHAPALSIALILQKLK